MHGSRCSWPGGWEEGAPLPGKKVSPPSYLAFLALEKLVGLEREAPRALVPGPHLQLLVRAAVGVEVIPLHFACPAVEAHVVEARDGQPAFRTHVHEELLLPAHEDVR